QTTCDFKQLKSDHWTMGALCNPKGRVITTFKALATDSGFLLIIPVSMIETVCKRLKMYILRSDVTVTDDSEQWRLIGFSSDLNSLDQIALPSTNNVTKNGDNYFLGCHNRDGQPSRYLILAKADCADDTFQQLSSLGLPSSDAELWNQHEIANSVPIITPPIAETFTPQMLNLDLLNAISFEKGCYTGQEIVARTQHLGTLKRRMVELTCTAELTPEPGTRIFSKSSQTQDSVGQIVRSASGLSNCSISDNQSVMLAVLQTSAMHSTDLYLESSETATLVITSIFDPQHQPQPQ
ncbi:MAG: hypothetical protein V3U88_00735, partial [Methylococcales bacterium]